MGPLRTRPEPASFSPPPQPRASRVSEIHEERQNGPMFSQELGVFCGPNLWPWRHKRAFLMFTGPDRSGAATEEPRAEQRSFLIRRRTWSGAAHRPFVQMLTLLAAEAVWVSGLRKDLQSQVISPLQLRDQRPAGPGPAAVPQTHSQNFSPSTSSGSGLLSAAWKRLLCSLDC